MKIPKHSIKNFLRFCIIFLAIISIRIWYLSVIQKNFWIQQARKPQRRTVLIHANRGTISDRFNRALAINRISYNASIYYAHIKQIPFIKWEKDATGKKIKIYPRREYIKKLSQFLGPQLQLSSERIEDSIHSKASLLPHKPYVIKENISEDDYYRLRMLEKDWIGLHAEICPERYYPYGKVASNFLGYMGAISQQHYLKIAAEIKILQTFLEEDEQGKEPIFPLGSNNKEEIIQRLEQLKEKAYNFNDLVGKSGVEYTFEQQLRGSHGKKIFSIDNKGNFVSELTYHRPQPGQNIQTSISLELQQYAEALLAQDEKEREGKSRVWDREKQESLAMKQPWIKGGAIVAMDPNTGEVLALASYPRFDPNDFIYTSNPTLRQQKNAHIHQWFETQSHIANIWNGQEPLTREFANVKKESFFPQKKALTWESYLDIILPQKGPYKACLERIKTLKNAIFLQEAVNDLLYFSGQDRVDVLFDVLFSDTSQHIFFAKSDSFIHQQIEKNLLKNFDEMTKRKKMLYHFLSMLPNNIDKIFVVDLCRLAVNSYAFSDELIEKVKNLSLSSYWTLSKACFAIEQEIKQIVATVFHDYDFRKWKEQHLEEFLKKKREIEKKKNTYARPYLDYLDQEENQQFHNFWQNHKTLFITSCFKQLPQDKNPSSSINTYLQEIANMQKKEDAAWSSSCKIINAAIDNLSYDLAYEFIRSIRSFSDLDRPLLYPYPRLKTPNTSFVEKDLAAAFYPKEGFGYSLSSAYQQATPLGSIFKITTAYCALKQRYQQLAEQNLSLQDLNPFTMIDKLVWNAKSAKTGSLIVGYNVDKTPYHRFYKQGRLPRSAHPNMGKVDLISALAQSSNPYFALLAGDIIHSPEDLLQTSLDLGFGKKTNIRLPGELAGNLPNDLMENKTGLYAFAIGQHSLVATPLQTAVMLSAIANCGRVFQPQIQKNTETPYKEIFFPEEIRNYLLDGLHQVVIGEKSNARSNIINKLRLHPDLKNLYNNIKGSLAGKTSTAEFMYNPDILPSSKARKYKHIWFGAIGFDPELLWEKPEIVVVVYLKYGDGGKEAAPLAAQMIQKYRQIQQKHTWHTPSLK